MDLLHFPAVAEPFFWSLLYAEVSWPVGALKYGLSKKICLAAYSGNTVVKIPEMRD